MDEAEPRCLSVKKAFEVKRFRVKSSRLLDFIGKDSTQSKDSKVASASTQRFHCRHGNKRSTR